MRGRRVSLTVCESKIHMEPTKQLNGRIRYRRRMCCTFFFYSQLKRASEQSYTYILIKTDFFLSLALLCAITATRLLLLLYVVFDINHHHHYVRKIKFVCSDCKVPSNGSVRNLLSNWKFVSERVCMCVCATECIYCLFSFMKRINE